MDEHPDEDDYLRIANLFYSAEQLTAPRYAMPYPNEEEAIRAGAVLAYVARQVERFTREGTRPRILEVGCGRGWLANLLSSFGPTVGIDPAEGPIVQAQREFPHVTFRRCLLSELMAEPGFAPFDVVVSTEVLEHVPWAHKEGFVRELAAAVDDAGICVLTTPRGELFRLYRRHHANSLQPVEDWVTERQLRELAARCGLRVVDHTRVRPRRFGLWGRIALSGKLRRFLETVRLRFLQSTFESRFCHYQVVLLARDKRS
jgi:2-polyprenyl-3-methyl-5-hydroxy-6-metoxy-1,4-benzoquinol methylase